MSTPGIGRPVNYEGAQFNWNREKNVSFAASIGRDNIIRKEAKKAFKVKPISCHTSLSATNTQLQLSDKEQDALKSKEPRWEKNYSQDDIDAVQLDKLLEEIHNTHQLNHGVQPAQHLIDKVLDFVHSNLNNPPESQRKIQPPSVDVACKSTSQSQTPISLSGSINEETAVLGKTSANNASQTAVFSLSDLAKQHKSQRAKLGSHNEPNHVSQRVNEGMVSLSSLIVQFSTQKKSQCLYSLDHPGPYFSSLENESNEMLTGLDIKPMHGIVSNSSSTNSLADLSRACTQSSGSPSTGSLLCLAQQHRHSTHPLFGVSPQSAQLNATKPSLAFHLSNVTLKDNKTRQCHKSNVAADASPLPRIVVAPNLSLAQCLKVSKTNTGRKKQLNVQETLEIEDSAAIDNSSQVDAVTHKSCLYQEQTPHADLITEGSSLGFALCYLKWTKPIENVPLNLSRPLRYPKFKCSTQVDNKEMYVDHTYSKIKPFDFSTPSPDDIIKNKQKQAFTRPDKEFEF